ncbi:MULTISPECIES: helix-turn-helix domain-containing protein [unclassified Synechococcus]|uniref:helix-turn-helix domain-containing protein n=1 Tax=unclassified Synechococcus TaxID=2626047 RepID=UPI0008FF788A|nr:MULTISPECIES: helix-turn-helix domain-containing protein [unclassified Synechococcus]APD47063.1 hypothetical protein BM449_00410 [Synechococcus sp. SynAce01]TWB89055.1 hypothetical protein FB106_11463 [Synechococcus sp. Ace-Pa]
MSTTPWLGAPEASRALGISVSTLYRWRTARLIKAGEHWRRKYPSPRSPVLYHLRRCEHRMSELSACTAASIEVPLSF